MTINALKVRYFRKQPRSKPEIPHSSPKCARTECDARAIKDRLYCSYHAWRDGQQDA